MFMLAINPLPAIREIFGLERDFIKTISNFPTQTDDLLYFQDIELSKSGCIPEFQKQLSQRNYTIAAQLLRESGANYYGADLFNLMEDMLCQLQIYLKAHPKINPHFFTEERPDNVVNGTMWISGNPKTSKRIWSDLEKDTWNQINDIAWKEFMEL